MASRLTPDVVDALKRMILTETDQRPLNSAIGSFLTLYGMSEWLCCIKPPPTAKLEGR